MVRGVALATPRSFCARGVGGAASAPGAWIAYGVAEPDQRVQRSRWCPEHCRTVALRDRVNRRVA